MKRRPSSSMVSCASVVLLGLEEEPTREEINERCRLVGRRFKLDARDVVDMRRWVFIMLDRER
jgi:hypothetical protein